MCTVVVDARVGRKARDRSERSRRQTYRFSGRVDRPVTRLGLEKGLAVRVPSVDKEAEERAEERSLMAPKKGKKDKPFGPKAEKKMGPGDASKRYEKKRKK